MIFITINRKKQIIENTGYIKCQLILLGLLLFFISTIFNKFLDYWNCALYFILKHSGILLIYVISLLYISSGHKIGMDYRQMEKLNYSFFKSGNSTLNFEENTNVSNSASLSKKKDIYNSNNKKNSSLIKKSNSSINSDSTESKEKDKFNKNLLYLNSLYIELTFLYIFVVVALITLSIFLVDNNTYIHEYSGKWRYQCPLEKYDMIANFTEFIAILYMVLLVIKIWNFTYVFKCVKYIGYSTIIWLSIGPLANVIY